MAKALMTSDQTRTTASAVLDCASYFGENFDSTPGLARRIVADASMGKFTHTGPDNSAKKFYDAAIGAGWDTTYSKKAQE